MIKAEDYDLLVACECSGEVRDAMIAAGIRAISCDLKDTQRPGPHYKGDVRDILSLRWPAMIAHPVCRYLANSGAKHLYLHGRKENGKNPFRWREMQKAAAFFNLFDKADHIPVRAVENPIMHAHALALVGRSADQYVQPHWFGSPFKKATGFWKHNLPNLPREHDLAWYAERGVEVKQAVWLMGPSEDREEKRSKTDPQIARALAQYWGPKIKDARKFFGLNV